VHGGGKKSRLFVQVHYNWRTDISAGAVVVLYQRPPFVQTASVATAVFFLRFALSAFSAPSLVPSIMSAHLLDRAAAVDVFVAAAAAAVVAAVADSSVVRQGLVCSY
jgi:hypothetical protein